MKTSKRIYTFQSCYNVMLRHQIEIKLNEGRRNIYDKKVV